MKGYIREEISEAVKVAVTKTYNIDISGLNFVVQHPDSQFGEYSSNIPLVLAKKVGDQPLSIGGKIQDLLKDHPLIEKVTIASPGFLNIQIKNHNLIDEINEITSNINNLELSNEYTNKLVLVEFGQPNTHKIPHIGHLFSYVFGESLSRLLETHKINVTRLNYQGDIGLHVAKCLWAYQQEPEPQFKNLEDAVNYLQKCYQKGSVSYEESGEAQEQIKNINTNLYLQDSSIFSLWEKTRSFSVDYYKEFEERLGIKYQRSYFESQVWKVGEKVVKENIGSVFEESDGAIIFDGEKFGLHKRVFINQKGNTTYEAKDLGLAITKYNDWKFDLSIITTAVEQSEYFKVMFKALETVNPFFEGKMKHLGFGMINLKDGKMSSRTGQIITAFELLKMAKEKIREFLKKNRNYSEEEIEKISEILGLASIKYSFLKVQASKDIEFSLDQSISFEGNSAAYIMYAYARAKSVFREGKINFDNQKLELLKDITIQKEENDLIRALYVFPEVLENSVSTYSPHILCQHLFDLAQKFNLFYMNCPILKADQNTKDFRLGLTKASAIIMKKSFELLGIEVLEKL